MKTNLHTYYFTWNNGSEFSINNGYATQIKDLGEKIEKGLESLGYIISCSSFTDWGYAFETTKNNKQINVIIEIQNLDNSKFRMSFKPNKHYYQIFSSFKESSSELYENIKHQDLRMKFNKNNNKH